MKNFEEIEKIFKKQNKAFEKAMLITAFLQSIALIIICFAGMYLTNKHLYFQEVFLIPIYLIMLIGIICLHKKMLKKVEKMI